MKIKSSMIMLVFAALAVNLHAASSALPAPLPEFMNQQQLATWNAEHASARQTVASAQENSTQFYTGKPYVADAGGYVYKYRTYNPEMSRWTSADPSGFPDGTNNRLYTANPTCQLDPNGLLTETDSEGGTVSVTGSFPGVINFANFSGRSQAQTASDTTGTIGLTSQIYGNTIFDSDNVIVAPLITVNVIPGTNNLTYTTTGSFGDNGSEGIVGTMINYTVSGDGTSTLIVHLTVSYALSADYISGGVSVGGDGAAGTGTIATTGLTKGPYGFGDYTFQE